MAIDKKILISEITRITQTFNRLAFVIACWGIAVFLGVLARQFWITELRESAEYLNIERVFLAKVLPNTFWVKTKFPIYCILHNDLVSINIDGTQMRYVFKGKEDLREYQFSPDGRSILLLTNKELYKLDQETKTADLIESLKDLKESGKVRGLIRRVRWSPDGQKILYETSKWSVYSSQDHIYVFDLKDKTRRLVKRPPYKIMEMFWDTKSENFYYSRYRSVNGGHTPYEISIFKVPLSSLEPELVAAMQGKENSAVSLDLKPFGIEIFLKGEQLAFGRRSQRAAAVTSPKDRAVGFDDRDYLYYEPSRGKRKRILRIPRGPRKAIFPINDLRWIPGERYVVMNHDPMGILILEPSTGKLGQLIEGDAFGWYERP